MNILFQSSLDAVQRDINRLNTTVHSVDERFKPIAYPVPRAGERVVFTFLKNGRGFEFDLEVYEVTYNYFTNTCTVELHLPKHRQQSIAEWDPWFKQFRYGA